MLDQRTKTIVSVIAAIIIVLVVAVTAVMVLKKKKKEDSAAVTPGTPTAPVAASTGPSVVPKDLGAGAFAMTGRGWLSGETDSLWHCPTQYTVIPNCGGTTKPCYNCAK